MPDYIHSYNTRWSATTSKFCVMSSRLEQLKNSFSRSGVRLRNALPGNIKKSAGRNLLTLNKSILHLTPSFILEDVQSISILTINCTRRQKQFLCLNIVLHNKTGPLFLKFNRCEKSFSFIMKIANSVDVASLKLRALMSRTTTSAYVKVQW